MINTEELIQLILQLIKENKEKGYKLGTVVSGNKIQFDGEDVPSEKQYMRLGSYTFSEGDRVILAVTGRTYVILGKVIF